MGTKQHDKEQIFSVAAEMQDAAQRAAYLDDACGDDRELRAEIEELLQHDLQANSMLDFPVLGLGSIASLPDGDPPLEAPGMQIGPYKLLQVIGEGGMGVVYMAEQREPVVRRVALKIIKPGMDTRQVIARFEAERQALAIMDHPNIAKVLDAGTTERGRPYFAMELVQGLPITKYCDNERLAPRERLELFLPVCQAVQHAHQKGIIHRDIKPSNIMVAIYDGQPVPKVIDFGVAKATGPQLTEKTIFTQQGQLVGTLEYMSPEQARLDHLDIDTRTDIYSLGVLLYELLTGGTPFDPERLRSAAFDEVMRIIREEEPPPPSSHLRTSDTLPSVAANRQIEPQQLKTLVHGELDWIVMKALDKERSRRYETASGFAEDIGRYLKDETVSACPPSAGYRFGKFARRNKTAIALTGVVAVALAVGLVGTAWQAVRATRAEQTARAEAQQAEANFQKARAAVDEITDIAQEQLVHIPNSENIQQNMLQKAQIFYQDFLEEKGDDSSIREETGNAYLRLVKIQRVLAQDHRASSERAIVIFEQLVAEFPDDSEYRYKLAVALLPFGISGASGQEKINAYRRALEICETLVAESPRDARYLSLQGDVHHWRGHLLSYDPKALREAREAFEQYAFNYEKLVVEFPDDVTHQGRLGHAIYHLGHVQLRIGDLGQTEEKYRKALSMLKKVVDESPYVPMFFGSNRYYLISQSRVFARLLIDEGRFDEARQILDEALPYAQDILDRYPNLPISKLVLPGIHAALGELHYRAGNWNDAIEAFKKSKELRNGSVSGNKWENSDGFDWLFLAMAHWQLGEEDEARRCYDQAVEWMEDNKHDNKASYRLRSEAAELLDIDESPPEEKEKPATEN